MNLDKKYFVNSIERIARIIEENRDHLSQLDSEIGDGDHGINLSIGFREVNKQLNELEANTSDISSFLKKVGMTLLSKVGGASGPLYGSYFMKMGAKVTDKNEVSFEEFIQMIDEAVQAVEKRGKASVGQKTMIDSLRPSIDYLMAQSTNENEIEVFSDYIEQMKINANKTIDMFPEVGRAARLGERAVGHKDPGAESAWLIMNGFLEEMEA